LLKISVRLVTVLVVIGFGVLMMTASQSTIAQKEEKWKTYYNADLRFALDYPVTTTTLAEEIVTTNITRNNSQVEFNMPNLFVTVKYKPYISQIDPQELAVISEQEMINDFGYMSETGLGVETVIYDGVVGYQYIIYKPNTSLVIIEIFFDDYNISLVGQRSFGFYDTVQSLLSSIKFFD
jgi:hypothetical protein